MEGGPPPCQTLYLSNLNERVTKDELKRCLLAVFSQFGRVLDVVATKTFALRGQAWVVLEDIPAAANAMRLMQGFVFLDKPMVRWPVEPHARVVPARSCQWMRTAAH